MARTTQTVIGLRAGALVEADLVVRRVRGSESLSGPYHFAIEFQPADGEPLALADLGGADALLTLERPGGVKRHVHGILWSAEMVEVVQGKPRYAARLVPKLERLRHVRRSRVFQKLSVPEVVRQVLGEGGIEHRLSLAASHPAREYCVQYRESDLAFVSRLLEDEGIFYWFEHSAAGHVMVLADSGSGCVELAGDVRVPFRVPVQAGDAPEDEHLFRLEVAQRVRPGCVALKDFDFARPALAVTASCREGSDRLGLEHYEYPGGFADPAAGVPLSRVRLEELRFGAENLEGEGTCLRFSPGSIFEVEKHPAADLNRRLLLVRIEHEARQQEGPGAAEAIEHGYRNRFLALDARVAYRPRRRTAWPVAAAETATVVGPGGEEIHPDAHGSVKVQFHWDREGRNDEASSCWVRVAQSWAGAGWGASFVPRIGQEVLVRFLDGDPDCPLVMGAIYNGANAPPVALPGEKTQSTLRTDSSPGSGGANELRFEDAQGGEQVRLHAQKDESVVVLHDKQQRIGANEALVVRSDRDREVQGEQQLRVGKDDLVEVDGIEALSVQGSRTTAVSGSSSETVASLQSVTIAADQRVSVGGSATAQVAAAAVLTVGGGLSVKAGESFGREVGGAFSGRVGGDRVEKVDGARTETIDDSLGVEIGADFVADAGGQAKLATGADVQEEIGAKAQLEATGAGGLLAKSFKLEADKLSVKVGGTLAPSIDKAGKVKLAAGAITIDGSTITLKGAQVKKIG